MIGEHIEYLVLAHLSAWQRCKPNSYQIDGIDEFGNIANQIGTTCQFDEEHIL